ncbi:MAG: DUF2796 domain-containing protein [Oceanospirillum sp.]|nr:DUF2796 domain-containing protein [Oceanospirillum sp.]
MNPVSLYFRRNSRFSRSVPLKATLPILMALATPLQAGSDVDLSAHEHGVANLTLAQDGKEISISFSAAADSVIGYEHAPGNEKEVEALHHAEEVLYHPEKWLTLPVSCEMEEREVSLPFLSADGHKERHHADEHDEHGHDDHDEHGHDEHHDGKEHSAHDDHKHEDHDEHEHDHDGHEHEGGHVDVEASYTFHCDSEQASPLELKLFSQLPYLELLRIEAVSERTVVVTEREGDGKLEW